MPHVDFASPTQSFGIARGQLAYYRALENENHIRILTNSTELSAHIAEWEAWEVMGAKIDQAPPLLGFVISMVRRAVELPGDTAGFYLMIYEATIIGEGRLPWKRKTGLTKTGCAISMPG